MIDRETNKPVKLWMIPPILLAMVALVQPALVHFLKWDRWEGGGFGMYCSVDQARLRPLRLVASTELGDLPAEGISWKHSRARLVTLPNTSLLVEELNTHSDKDWVVIDEEGDNASTRSDTSFKRVAPADSLPNDESLMEVEELRLNVYRMTHEGDGRMTVKVLKSVSD